MGRKKQNRYIKRIKKGLKTFGIVFNNREVFIGILLFGIFLFIMTFHFVLV